MKKYKIFSLIESSAFLVYMSLYLFVFKIPSIIHVIILLLFIFLYIFRIFLYVKMKKQNK